MFSIPPCSRVPSLTSTSYYSRRLFFFVLVATSYLSSVLAQNSKKDPNVEDFWYHHNEVILCSATNNAYDIMPDSIGSKIVFVFTALPTAFWLTQKV